MKTHDAKAFLVTCINFRFINIEVEHMTEKKYSVNYDAFVLARVNIVIMFDSVSNDIALLLKFYLCSLSSSPVSRKFI